MKPTPAEAFDAFLAGEATLAETRSALSRAEALNALAQHLWALAVREAAIARWQRWVPFGHALIRRVMQWWDGRPERWVQVVAVLHQRAADAYAEAAARVGAP